MAICAVCSASGSRGVTTICLGLSLSWPRPVVLVEADPTGGSAILAGYFRGRRATRHTIGAYRPDHPFPQVHRIRL